LNGVGGAMNHLGYAWDRGMNETDHGQYDSPEEVLFACAGAAMFRRDSFLEAGAFDEAFFMYHEDVDLGWRLWLMGYRVITAPRAVAYHHFGGSTKASQGNLWRELMGERHNIRALLKNYEPRNVRRALAGILLMNLPRSRKWGQIKNLAWNLGLLPDTWRHRRRIQRSRRRADREISRLIVESIRCAEGPLTSP
jgi:GT2 family glycosyltransferase